MESVEGCRQPSCYRTLKKAVGELRLRINFNFNFSAPSWPALAEIPSHFRVETEADAPAVKYDEHLAVPTMVRDSAAACGTFVRTSLLAPVRAEWCGPSLEAVPQAVCASRRRHPKQPINPSPASHIA